jgi:hypothetical protein
MLLNYVNEWPNVFALSHKIPATDFHWLSVFAYGASILTTQLMTA